MRVELRSVHDAFDYVMDHYYPYGMREFAVREDSYAVISIQDSYCGGFGVEFSKNEFCKDVLTLHFDDIEHEVDGAVLFGEIHAERIIDFIEKNKSAADTLLVHCYAGQSRSRAVAAFAADILGQNSEEYFDWGLPNMHVLGTLRSVLSRKEQNPDGSDD